MKKYMIIAMAALWPAFSQAQTETLNKFKEKYAGMEEVTKVDISGAVFDMLAQIAESEEDDPDAEAFSRISRGLQKMEVLVVPYARTGLSDAEVKDLFAGLDREKYETYVSVRDGNEKVDVLAREDDGGIGDILILVNGDEEFVMLILQGDIAYDDLSYLARKHGNFH